MNFRELLRLYIYNTDVEIVYILPQIKGAWNILKGFETKNV